MEALQRSKLLNRLAQLDGRQVCFEEVESVLTPEHLGTNRLSFAGALSGDEKGGYSESAEFVGFLGVGAERILALNVGENTLVEKEGESGV